MSLEALNERVKKDLSCLAFGGPDWVLPIHHPEGHVYDAVIVGGGQCGLGIAFGLLCERVSNILVIDENSEGLEGPWVTYARMMTLRTPKQLTPIDLGIPSLTCRAWWEAQFGPESWEALDKIPKGDWMRYLRWYREVLRLPVMNRVKLKLIEPAEDGVHRLHIEGAGATSDRLLARKVILATGIQGGGQWYVPSMISEKLPRRLYAHTSEAINFEALKGKKIAVLGGGASAFDNANFALSEGAGEVHVFVRREQLPRINPIRQMESSGIIAHFHTLSDADKYAVMAHFFKFNQPPTNDTFGRAASWPGFHLHLGAPWLDVAAADDGAIVTTPQGKLTFDFLIISTGLRTDPALRPELSLVESHIARWRDRYQAPEEIANPMLDAHPYLSSGFAFRSRDEEGQNLLHGLFAFNYSGMISCGLSASALSGMKYSIPEVVAAVTDQLFRDDRKEHLKNFFDYDEPEFVGEWPKKSRV
ncbi:NAD(P)-binding domain-containing protein [Sporolactobacillus putidus]|uniref:FAD-dependent urate hydroxylase n=1 Tax=Sporolactobacillus putidus TaxID=492735 RepID=A0A917W2A4_9BACL|nr:NAD(P)/FAD-dependent oxidoreductase [Sporolactobacillus putidus]GGL60854.1 FAD-dependent urate hydroxylase [Sporolactobacillus putidus]